MAASSHVRIKNNCVKRVDGGASGAHTMVLYKRWESQGGRPGWDPKCHRDVVRVTLSLC